MRRRLRRRRRGPLRCVLWRVLCAALSNMAGTHAIRISFCSRVPKNGRANSAFCSFGRPARKTMNNQHA